MVINWVKISRWHQLVPKIIIIYYLFIYSGAGNFVKLLEYLICINISNLFPPAFFIPCVFKHQLFSTILKLHELKPMKEKQYIQ